MDWIPIIATDLLLLNVFVKMACRGYSCYDIYPFTIVVIKKYHRLKMTQSLNKLIVLAHIGKLEDLDNFAY